jgi:hypothetical protein
VSRFEKRVEDEVQFVGEQDGEAERELKRGLVKIFEANREVERAYLARVRYIGASQGVGVALAIVAPKTRMEEIVASVNDVFRLMFNKGESLDILRLSAPTEQKVLKACKPFFVRESDRTLPPGRN